ncbi:MAG: hypothetical protein AAGC60_15575 [Acidobacteriota bacterium]
MRRNAFDALLRDLELLWSTLRWSIWSQLRTSRRIDAKLGS